MKHLKKLLSWMCAVVLIGGLTLCTSCTSNKDNAPSVEASEFIPKAPDYNDATMWVTADGDTDGTGADIFYVVSTWEEDWTQRTMVNGNMPLCRRMEPGTPRPHADAGNRQGSSVYRQATVSSPRTTVTRPLTPG